MNYGKRRDYEIPLFFYHFQIIPFDSLDNKLLAETMWDKSNVLFQSKKVFFPTVKKKKKMLKWS